MGLGGISIWQLLIILVIVALIFGTKRLRGIGGDLGGAVKGFKKPLTMIRLKMVKKSLKMPRKRQATRNRKRDF